MKAQLECYIRNSSQALQEWGEDIAPLTGGWDICAKPGVRSSCRSEHRSSMCRAKEKAYPAQLHFVDSLEAKTAPFHSPSCPTSCNTS